MQRSPIAMQPIAQTATLCEFRAPIAAEIWQQKYRLMDGTTPIDQTLNDTFRRVARAAASIEQATPAARAHWAETYHRIMADFSFLPAGRILAGAGSNRDVTLFNCFVLGRIDDDLGAIFNAVKEAALTMQAGGGIGHDFSTLRPKGSPVKSLGAHASGPVSFMDVWDGMCRTIMSAGQRRGAMMATLRCDHPDIIEFITAKSDPARLRNFNLSVLITDAFVRAIKNDQPWTLTFDGKTYATLAARDLWRQITHANYTYAEPGVIFIDQVNARNNLAYCEQIQATNPCGEQPLPPYGACLLGSLNLTAFIDHAFSPKATLDVARLSSTAAIAVRFLDAVIDVSRYPLPAQEHEAKSKRRIGLGLTGLADALIMLGERYGSKSSLQLASSWMSTIQSAAYRASAELAAEKGPFPLFDAKHFLAAPNPARLPADLRQLIATHGIRNGCLTSIAPTGTISLLAGNVSSGIEPVFDFRYSRRVLGPKGEPHNEIVEDYAHALFRNTTGAEPAVGSTASPWVRATQLAPDEHLAMQSALQPHVDSAISKTINCPQDIASDTFADIYLQAYDMGLKGCTTFRPNAVTGSVLSELPAPVSCAPTNPQLCPRCAKPHDPEPQPAARSCEPCPNCGAPNCA
jgi:ribonucleoside-diphosphate reductase alpha chain